MNSGLGSAVLKLHISQYFIWAGAMIASNGLLDVVIWSCTMVFLAPKDIKKAGLEEFRFMRTNSKKYGNIIWVEGGKKGGRESSRNTTKCLPLRELKIRSEKRESRRGLTWDSKRASIATGQAETGIQIQTSTTVMVENRWSANLSVFGNPFRPVSDIVSVPTRVAHRF